jgi:hypothetical protein
MEVCNHSFAHFPDSCGKSLAANHLRADLITNLSWLLGLVNPASHRRLGSVQTTVEGATDTAGKHLFDRA